MRPNAIVGLIALFTGFAVVTTAFSAGNLAKQEPIEVRV